MKTERKKLIELLRLDYTASNMALALMKQAADMLEADSEPKCSDQAPQPQRPLPTAVEALAADAARYRWLREQARLGTFGGVVTDAAIDAAMKGETT